MDIEAKCCQYFQIIEDRVRLVENQFKNIDHIIKEKVKHEVHGQLNSDMKTILKDEITASRADIKNTVIADLSRVVSDKVDNLKGNEERKLNIIVFGAEESAILVLMSSQDVKKKIMQNLHNLRLCDSNISMNHDMTKTEREETKHLVEKAREINKQDHMGEWSYKVQGPPWEKKILRIQKVNLQ